MDYVNALLPYLPYLGFLPLVVGLIGFIARGEVRSYAKSAIGAAYRVAIHSATELAEDGSDWLAGPSGIAYRKQLAIEAYRHIPASVGRFPIGAIKLLVSEERFSQIVESAFQEIVHLSDNLETVQERPTA